MDLVASPGKGTGPLSPHRCQRRNLCSSLSPAPSLVVGRLLLLLFLLLFLLPLLLPPPPPHGGPEVSVCLSSCLAIFPAPVLSSDSEQWEGREVTEEQRAGTGMETKPRALGGLHLHGARAAWAAAGLVEVRVCGPQEPQLTSEWQQQDALR